MQDQGGLMGIPILPWTQNDEEKYKLFEITADSPWFPRKQIPSTDDVLVNTSSFTPTPGCFNNSSSLSSEWSPENSVPYLSMTHCLRYPTGYLSSRISMQ